MIVAAHAQSIAQVVGKLPKHAGLAVVVMAAEEDAAVAAQLRPASLLPVVEERQRITLASDRIIVIPHSHGAAFQRDEVVIAQPGDPRVPVDGLLRSLANEHRQRGIAVLLDGRGTDGITGIKHLKEAGGLTITQAPEDVDGAVATPIQTAKLNELADLVLPLSAIGDRLVALGRSDEAPGQDAPTATDDEPRAQDVLADTLHDILVLLRVRSGHDFGSYKRATLYRRVSRRMQVCECESIAAYHRHLRDHPGELSHLLRDFLISVTNFFRDRSAFDALALEVVPKLFAGKTAADQVRVWVAGCATGEEAYSIGILLHEHASRLAQPPQLQIFATDIDESALAEARVGRYPATIISDVSPARLERFFTHEGDDYRVRKELRETVLFSVHNLLRDPPFSRLDLVSCRNLLIYLNRDAQDRVLNVFHFGLRPDGMLFLGSSEAAENTAVFTVLDSKHRLFLRRSSLSRLGDDALVTAGRWHPPSAPQPTPTTASPRVAVGELHHRLVEEYAPPSILVDSDLDIVHISQRAGRLLHVTGGEPSRQLVRLIIPALQADLRAAIYAARQSQRGSDSRIVRFNDGGTPRAIEIRVRTIDQSELGRGSLLVMFDELDHPAGEPAPDRPASAALEPVMRVMEEELHRTRDQLRNTVEQYETSVEELKASNEELQAINEELRSATEELETSKEELQSVNEELTTVNHELKHKIDEISHANSDLQNLMSSTDIGVVFLDRGLNIKRFTPRVRDLFNVIPGDIGRPLAHVTHRLEIDDLPQLAHSVLQTLHTLEREVRTRDGRRYLVRMLPYRSLDDRIAGIVVTFIEVSDLRNAVDARDRSEAALQAVLVDVDRSKDEFLATLSHELRNPLTPLKIALDVARLATGDADRLDKSHAIMERQVAQLSRLVDQLLDLSRITQGKIELDRISLDPALIVESALEATRPLLQERRHHLAVTLPSAPCWVIGDHLRLTQVLTNLLSNAARFTPPGGHVDLRLDADLGRRVLRIRLRDDGEGIAPELLPRLFDIFVQSRDPAGRPHGGLGIGLNLVRRLVELHGGAVSAASAGRGQGTELTVELPLASEGVS